MIPTPSYDPSWLTRLQENRVACGAARRIRSIVIVKREQFMPPRSTNASARAFTGACAVALSLVASPSHAQPGPFAGLAGAWSGTGTIEMSNGASERIRCRATYSVGAGGNNLQQSLRCASDSYRFDLGSNVNYAGGRISGTWTEASRNASGNLSGTVKATEILARADGPGFAANILLVTRGDRQSVSIRSAGTDIREVSIVLTRAK
jgi:hypothetical protein